MSISSSANKCHLMISRFSSVYSSSVATVHGNCGHIESFKDVSLKTACAVLAMEIPLGVIATLFQWNEDGEPVAVNHRKLVEYNENSEYPVTSRIQIFHA